jgi:hypothetical protein
MNSSILAHEIIKKVQCLKEKLDEEDRIMIIQTEQPVLVPSISQEECMFEKYLTLLKTKCLTSECQSSDPSLSKFIMREYSIGVSAKDRAIETLMLKRDSIGIYINP